MVVWIKNLFWTIIELLYPFYWFSWSMDLVLVRYIYIYNILLMAVEYVFVASHCIGYNFQFEMELLFLDQGLSIVMDPGGNSWISICFNT